MIISSIFLNQSSWIQSSYITQSFYIMSYNMPCYDIISIFKFPYILIEKYICIQYPIEKYIESIYISYTNTVNSPACSSWFFINKVWKRNCDSSARGPRYTDLQDGAQDPFIYPSAEHSANFCQAVALFNPPPSLYLPLCEQDTFKFCGWSRHMEWQSVRKLWDISSILCIFFQCLFA